jgi:hypothetical protein
LQSNDKDAEDDLIKMIANVVPVLNGRDSAGQVIHLGSQLKIPRYLLVLLAAESRQMFRLGFGKEIDGSIYFSLYGLSEVADSFKQYGPHHQPIQYDRTKVAARIYSMISNKKGLVAMRKIDGASCVKITEKGVKTSNEVLKELIVYDNMNKDSDERIITKGVLGYDLGLQRAQKRLTEKISEINLPFEDELNTIEDDL